VLGEELGRGSYSTVGYCVIFEVGKAESDLGRPRHGCPFDLDSPAQAVCY
jgi:hypothetical protein